MIKLLKQKRDSNYYWGLALMLTLPLALVLEFWKYSFCKPSHFPIYLLIYGWGYLLLLKSDLCAKILALEAELRKAPIAETLFETISESSLTTEVLESELPE